MRAAASLAVVAIVATGCWRHKRLAAPQIPERILPNVSTAGAPAPGLGRVLLDVQEGPAVVERVHGASASGIAGTRMLSGSVEISRRVCVTPCVLDVPAGPQELRFTLIDDEERTSTGFVNVDARPSAYRHAIGTQRSRAWKGFVGWPLLAFGALLDIGFGVTAAKGELELNGGTIAGAGIGIGLTVLGGWLLAGSVIEQQPGSGVQWHP